jgi:asparagine synthase (glutamine-hydrolysing)
MSGIVGIINLNGEPIDRDPLERMTKFMSFRGPDAQNIWTDSHVGFGHTMLRTTEESLKERQPFSLEGKVWITADARIDGRKELIQELESNGREDLKAPTDVELILHAYQVWGESCVNRLVGDFAFAIWDGTQKRLFCARDHFGIKPFYYAYKGNQLIFSNTLNCLRLHPNISNKMNDLAIADFLLFDFNQDPATTTFADIQRLPPAHYLVWSNGPPYTKCYWTIPVDGKIQYKNSKDYITRFKELMCMAVGDRLRTDHIGVLMSGGLDSSTVAATAQEVLLKQAKPFNLRAVTSIYDKLIPDQERYYSALVAEALGIPIHYLVVDEYKLYEHRDKPQLKTPEPVHNPTAAIDTDLFKKAAEYGRVVLTGLGGDNGFYFLPGPYIFNLLKRLQIGRLIADVGQMVYLQHQIPRLGIRTMIRKWLKFGNSTHNPIYPDWINDSFANRTNLRKRWQELNNGPEPRHPVRPKAYQSLIAPFWPFLFENFDAGTTLIQAEVRHPFFDIRLMDYLLAIPPMQWSVYKHLLRKTMQGVLPEQVRLRPKAPLASEPVLELLRQTETQWINDFKPKLELLNYVNRYAIPKVSMNDSFDKIWVNLRPLSLNYWLQDVF